MRRRVETILGASSGSAAIEFAIIAPVLLTLIMGILQLGILFYANAGLHQAVEAGARYATIYPRPNDSQITALVLKSGYGMQGDRIERPTVKRGTVSGTTYVDIRMGYSVPLNFIFFDLGPVKLEHTRRAYQV
jgi:Flp pilus assembly protein TadG